MDFVLFISFFSLDDIEFYRNKYPDILIATHPECDPSICDSSDFVGSTSQLIKYIKSLSPDQKIAVGTEFNMVNRLRKNNTYILSSSKPECPTMNETTLEDLYQCLKLLEVPQDKPYLNEVLIDAEVSKWSNIALNRMFEV